MSKDGEQDQAGTLNENGKENIDVGVDTDVGGASGGRPEDEPFLETQEERDKFYQEASLVRAREVERRLAIATGKMDDPLVPKRLSDAITMVGTCPDMCPRFERYRRERENNLFIPWETYPPPNNTFPGSSTKRINHAKAVKMYERAAGDKTLPSDLRPPLVLRRTLDYLFHDLMMNEGFIETFNFVRDRTRSVRNDFTMQHEQGEEAMRCHARSESSAVSALHFMTSNEAKEKGKGGEGFSVNLEEQQLMNTLQSLKEFYSDQRPHFQSSGPSTSYIFPAELEMRLYHRLVHIRDQVERHDDVPPQIQSHPLFALVSKFRKVVQRDSSEKEKISKRSKLVVSSEAMGVFGELVGVLQAQSAGLADVPGGVGGQGMIFLLACILEHLFGKDTIDEMESIRGGQRLCDIIDGVDSDGRDVDQEEEGEDYAEGEPDESKQEEYYDEFHEGEEEVYETDKFQPSEAGTTSAFGAGPSPIPISSVPSPVTQSAFSNLTVASANPFGTGAFGIGGPPSLSSSPFGGAMFGQPVSSNLPFQPSSSSSPFGRPAAQNEAPASRLPFVPPPPSSSSPFGQKAQSVQPTTSAFASPSAFLAPPPPAEKTKIFSSPLPFVLTPLVPPASNSGSMTMGTSAVGPRLPPSLLQL
ncbi:hypothetical protein D9757_012910 [Collybiopsis confluens]|uniref:SAC3/GANP/THP3 conserved domain-containing protein n=1 Tax=Collybiopsis confluens TaxID=2823264 RepID=A0A8H5G0H5_9AGAR|nr:hypothetical protein D9757_012910 [Collybiopsis confluens]